MVFWWGKTIFALMMNFWSNFSVAWQVELGGVLLHRTLEGCIYSHELYRKDGAVQSGIQVIVHR